MHPIALRPRLVKAKKPALRNFSHHPTGATPAQASEALNTEMSCSSLVMQRQSPHSSERYAPSRWCPRVAQRLPASTSHLTGGERDRNGISHALRRPSRPRQQEPLMAQPRSPSGSSFVLNCTNDRREYSAACAARDDV